MARVPGILRLYVGCGFRGASASIFGSAVAVSDLAGATEYSGAGSVLSGEGVASAEVSGDGLSEGTGSEDASGVGST
jgi:hypothetical protein